MYIIISSRYLIRKLERSDVSSIMTSLHLKPFRKQFESREFHSREGKFRVSPIRRRIWHATNVIVSIHVRNHNVERSGIGRASRTHIRVAICEILEWKGEVGKFRNFPRLDSWKNLIVSDNYLFFSMYIKITLYRVLLSRGNRV